jgi:hypothetical protein
MLLSAYRRDEWADPQGFAMQLGVVLEGFPEEVIIAVTHPSTGLQRRLKFPPTIAEVVEACEAEGKRIETARRYAQMKRSPPPQRLVDYSPGRRANLLVHSDAPQYPQVLEWIQTADEADWKADEQGRGVWVNYLASPLGGMRCGPMHALKRPA